MHLFEMINKWLTLNVFIHCKYPHHHSHTYKMYILYKYIHLIRHTCLTYIKHTSDFFQRHISVFVLYSKHIRGHDISKNRESFENSLHIELICATPGRYIPAFPCMVYSTYKVWSSKQLSGCAIIKKKHSKWYMNESTLICVLKKPHLNNLSPSLTLYFYYTDMSLYI